MPAVAVKITQVCAGHVIGVVLPTALLFSCHLEAAKLALKVGIGWHLLQILLQHETKIFLLLIW